MARTRTARTIVPRRQCMEDRTRLLNPLKSQVDPYQTFIVVIGKPAALASNSRNAEAGLGFNPLR